MATSIRNAVLVEHLATKADLAKKATSECLEERATLTRPISTRSRISSDSRRPAVLSISSLMLLFVVAVSPSWGGQNVTQTKVFSGSTTETGQVISYPTDGQATITSIRLEFGPGGDVGWHKHLAPSHIYVIEGTLTIEASDGRQQSFEEGTGFMPIMNIWHNARNLGPGPLTALLVISGVEGKRGIVFRDAD